MPWHIFLKFAGQTPIARRYKSDIATREYAVQQKDFISYKRWQERMVVEKQYIEKTEEIILVSLFIVPELFKQNRFTGFQPFCITL